MARDIFMEKNFLIKSGRVLWIDACLRHSSDSLLSSLKHFCDIEIVIDGSRPNIANSLKKTSPALIIFDFDLPDLTGLKNLQEIKKNHSSIPVLMLTNEHSENLAVWALRTRVWDYLVKPFSVEILLDRIRLLLRERVDKNIRVRANFMSPPPIPVESRFRNRIDSDQVTQITSSYVKDHLHEKIQEETVAQLCGMSRYVFSRAFKRNQGITFRNYVIHCRLQKAATMLRKTSCTVTDIAFSVGFNDLSHFGQLFRRTMKCTPLEYRLSESD